nr:hypothetical protein GCM10020092_089350 [Actinoplanes digitatis]
MPAQPDLPLRPMTLGEALDAAISLLRARAVPLLAAAAVLALLEQVLIVSLRTAAFATPPYYGLGTRPLRRVVGRHRGRVRHRGVHPHAARRARRGRRRARADRPGGPAP